MSKNGDQLDKFLDGFIDNPRVLSDIKLLAGRLKNDEEFLLSYLQFTGIMMIRFPSLFDKVVINLLDQLIHNKENY